MDVMAEKFNQAIEEVQEHRTIIIIASAKLTSWQPPKKNSKRYEVENVTATKFYINYGDKSVAALRKMPKNETLTVADIKTLPIQYAKDSGLSYHIEDFSDPNIKSPDVDKRPKRKKKLTKIYCD
ncbi:hypothetical protein ACET3Z_005205 [Daucus carota]